MHKGSRLAPCARQFTQTPHSSLGFAPCIDSPRRHQYISAPRRDHSVGSEGEKMSAKSLFLLLALTPIVSAKPIVLGEKLAADDCFRVQLRMNLTGTITFRKDGKQQTIPLEASAHHAFVERLLSVAKSGSAEKTARVYETAEATIKPGQHVSQRSLRPDRNLLIAQWQNDDLTVYSPAGALLRDELDLCSEHFDTLHLTGLLPGGERSV